jgi:hypothetical protein
MEGNIKYVVLLIQVSGFKSDMIKIIARECARACVWFYVMCLLLLSPQAPVARHAHHFFFGAGLSSAARARLLSRRSMDMSEAEAEGDVADPPLPPLLLLAPALGPPSMEPEERSSNDSLGAFSAALMPM